MANFASSTDCDIRSALHRERLRHHKEHFGTLVIDELGLAHARSRVDVAVINGYIHGYEIKSAQDDLERLGSQMDVYRQTLQKLTIVAASKHLQMVLFKVPDWCGVIEAVLGPRGGIKLRSVRSARSNPDIDPVMLAHLLWRPEALDLLSGLASPRRNAPPAKAALRNAERGSYASRDHGCHSRVHGAPTNVARSSSTCVM